MTDAATPIRETGLQPPPPPPPPAAPSPVAWSPWVVRLVMLSTAFLVPQFLITVHNYRALEVGDTLLLIALLRPTPKQ
ncbi:hypothetical protein A6A40_17580 (plasmid) [Azospirillum humicireducens]|uniref:Uncharacterized protein n=1 Tax=Azospirillum humicireducens TaxID=1226968 RepID=A0A2R4VR20_9PROT|nr:hypothetical protein [Azospirillum humicireducens]AWB06862.1 hypothetical protein A6A40_17580 [Azospirillum humicireducens]